jgi:hypothetical protein
MGMGSVIGIRRIHYGYPTDTNTGPGSGGPDTMTDSDGDGFTDYEECCGIALANGSHFNGFKEGGDCLDPNNRDLFVILIPAAQNSKIPSNEFMYASALPIRIHSITPDKATSNPDDYTLDRIVSPNSALTPQQKAVRLTEDLTPYDPTKPLLPLGISGEGTPNSRDNATIYTERTDGLVRHVYTNNNIAFPDNLQDIIDTYIRHVIAHELGHMIRPLAPVIQADYVSFGGYHYKSGTTYNKENVILDQYVKYTVKGGNVTFYIGTIYTPADIAGIILRQP